MRTVSSRSFHRRQEQQTAYGAVVFFFRKHNRVERKSQLDWKGFCVVSRRSSPKVAGVDELNVKRMGCLIIDEGGYNYARSLRFSTVYNLRGAESALFF